MKFPLRYQTLGFAGVLCLGMCTITRSSALPGATPPSAAAEPTDSAADQASLSQTADTVVIPGPLRSFLRMSGVSQEVSPDDVLPMLARNVYLYGYHGGKETEFLVLVDRYVRQARELQALSGSDGIIHISGCDDATRLIQVLGYKLQRTCGQKGASLVTANAERAFLTIDSGFPLTDLEQALEQNAPFTYPYPATRVPIFFTEKEWLGVSLRNRKPDEDLLDLLLHDQDVDRLYAALAKCDEETRSALKDSPGLRKLAPLASVLDLYGSQITIHSGSVVVPGGSDKSWEDLVGVDPHASGEFVVHLLTRDGGWLAAYFDVLSRVSQSQQAHLTEGTRLKRFYSAYRSTAIRTNASRGVFPKNADLLILLTSLKWEPDGDLVIPGGIGVWEEILTQKTKSKEMRDWLKRSHGWDTTGKLLETLVASSTFETESGPVQIFLMLSAMNEGRPPQRQLSDETERLVASRLPQFNRWFPIFASFRLSTMRRWPAS